MSYNLAKLESLIGGHWTVEQLDLIRATIAPKATFDELALFVQVASSRGLDPFARQIYAVHRWDARASRECMSIQVGIDGYRALAERTGCYAGNDDPVFREEHGAIVAATVTVWRVVNGCRMPFTATARWSEYCQTKKGGSPTAMWHRMPYTMLGKCAESLALRKGFPAALGGLHTPEEMGGDSDSIDADFRPVDPDKTTSRWEGDPEQPKRSEDAIPALGTDERPF